MERKQRVLLVHNYYRIPGGEDVVAENEKHLLEAHGHFVILYGRSNRELEKLPFFRKLLLPLTAVFSLRTYREVKKLIRENQIDVVHVHNTLSLISPSVYYAAFACKKPVVQTVHNFRLLCPAATFQREGRVCEACVDRGLSCAVRYGCYRGSKLQTFVSAAVLKIHRLLGTYGRLFYICLTDFNREKLLLLNCHKKKYIDEEKVFVKTNFVKVQKTDRPRKKEQYLYVGRLERLKGIHVLMEAWRAFPEKALLLCGDGPEEALVRFYVEKYHMTGVRLLGRRSHEEVVRFMAESRALILPSMCYEGQPMVIIESYAVNTPVIASDIGNAGNMVIPGVTGFRFACGDETALREAVMRMDREKEWNVEQIYRSQYMPGKNYRLLRDIYIRAEEQ